MESIFEKLSSSEVLDWARVHSRRRPLSHKQLSEKLGYNSERTIGMVLKGQRNMSTQLQRKVAEYLALSSKEKAYFDLLVEKDRLEKQKKNTYKLRQKLDSLRPPKFKLTVLTNSQLMLFQKWFSFTIIELIKILGSEANLSNIHRALKGNVLKGEVEDALNKFCSLGLIRENKSVYSVEDKDQYFLSTTDLPNSTIRKIHKNQLLRAIKTLDEQIVKERCFYGINIKINKNHYKEIEKRIVDFISELAQLSDDDVEPKDAVVYQINAQAYIQAEPR